MAIIKLSVSCILFYILYQLSAFIIPLFSWATNLFMLAFLAWTGGKYLTKKYVLPRMPQINSRGKAVLVTGCDTGFGHGIAISLKNSGFHVFACCLDPNGEGAKSLQSQSQGKLSVIPLDVSKEESVKKCHETIQKLMKDPTNGIQELFAIINNAGISDIKGMILPDVFVHVLLTFCLVN